MRVVLVWHGEPLEERVFAEPQSITVGPSKKDTFVVPSSRLGEQFPLFRPSADETGYVLTLAEGMSGKINVDNEPYAVDEFLRRGRGVPVGVFREQPLATSDWGIVGLDETGDVAFFFQFVAPGVAVGPTRGWLDRFFGQALIFAAVVNIAILGIGWIFGGADDDALDLDPPPSTAIAKILLEPPKEPEAEKPQQKRKVREEDASKRAREKEGKVGNADAKVAETKIPKGDKDQIVKKVSNMGLLGITKASKQSAALKMLLSDTPDATMTTAMAGLKGTELVIGRGSGGMSTRGEGPGGGGKGGGQLLGVGNLAVGGGGKGAHANGNGPGHVGKEMKVAVQTGTPNSDGGLSKEQILKVVQSHAAAIQFCYEKELQRFPHLAGKVVVDWKVNLDGRVEATRVGSSSLGNPSAESCMVRQVKNWQFPKPNGVICNVSFPFFFKGQ
ncbi:MAG: putative abductin-like protein [Myxococcales bacterium]|nr:putative abductin-like protein [Myxococcales bacterium]